MRSPRRAPRGGPFNQPVLGPRGEPLHRPDLTRPDTKPRHAVQLTGQVWSIPRLAIGAQTGRVRPSGVGTLRSDGPRGGYTRRRVQRV